MIKRQKELGWIPANTKLTPRHETMASWDSIPEEQRPFQRRLMEVFAGFVEHTDAQVGKLVDSLEELGLRDNTIIIYIWGDNGSSAEGQQGTISELLAQNNLPNTFAQQITALDELGGLDVLGSAKVDNMYHAGWAWAGSAPCGPLNLSLRISAAPATPWSSPGPRASSPTGRRGRSSTTSTTLRRHCTA